MDWLECVLLTMWNNSGHLPKMAKTSEATPSLLRFFFPDFFSFFFSFYSPLLLHSFFATREHAAPNLFIIATRRCYSEALIHDPTPLAKAGPTRCSQRRRRLLVGNQNAAHRSSNLHMPSRHGKRWVRQQFVKLISQSCPCSC